MRTDPRDACKNESERLAWALVHDLIAHPLMAVTNYSGMSLRFHDWTSRRAWPRSFDIDYVPVVFENDMYGTIVLLQQSAIIWKVSHPNVSHDAVFQADDATEALEKALAWFDLLSNDLGGVFRPKGATNKAL